MHWLDGPLDEEWHKGFGPISVCISSEYTYKLINVLLVIPIRMGDFALFGLLQSK